MRLRGQTTVEAALCLVLLVSVFSAIVTLAWWGHAENVVTAAVQDGARSASAWDGDSAHGLAIARALVQAGLGSGASRVQLAIQQDADSVTVSARGQWPIVAAPGLDLSLPLVAQARVEREQWQP